LLCGSWIDSISVVQCHHYYSLPQVVQTGKCLSHPHRGESTSAGCPCIPTLTFQVEPGTYSPPNPPTKLKMKNTRFFLV
jgi:hypothetical protein